MLGLVRARFKKGNSVMDKNNIEPWRKKTIDFLNQSKDPEVRKAIKVLKEGKGYLTHILPTRIIFYSDIND